MLQYVHSRLKTFSWFVLAIVVGYIALTLQHSFVCHHVQHDENACVVCTLAHTITSTNNVRIAIALFFVLLTVVLGTYSFTFSLQRCAANLNKAPPTSK